ncbi:RimK family alpha-L-glutamate ligase [bacterium]|nr:RimK family alpha-L-glutamate ligase [bacterium]
MDHIVVLTRQPESYAARRFLEAANDRQELRLRLMDPHDLYLQISQGEANTFLAKEGFDPASTAVIPRLGSTATEYSLAALDLLERAGASSVNSAASLLRLRNKFSALAELGANGIPVPDSAMLRAPGEVSHAVERLGGYPVVIKFIRGSQGVGVIYAPDESVVTSVLEAMNLVQYDVLLQRYYPAGAERDLRVLVLGGKPRWAVRRTVAAGKFRSNFHRGGTAEAVDIDEKTRELAARAAGVFGLGLAGVDLIEDDGSIIVMEVNSSPGFQTIEQAHKNDVAGAILDYTAMDKT